VNEALIERRQTPEAMNPAGANGRVHLKINNKALVWRQN
jgi:hypothetical protein